MRPESIVLSIEEKLTPEEKQEIGSKLAIATAEAETAKLEKKQSDGIFNERLKTAKATALQLAKKLNKGTETAQIGCDIKYDVPEIGKKSYIRFDNGEVVQVLDMSWEEKQETIQFPLTEAKPEEPTNGLQTPEMPPEVSAKPEEETTKLCPFPGCILFSDHDGGHEFEEGEEPPEEMEASA